MKKILLGIALSLTLCVFKGHTQNIPRTGQLPLIPLSQLKVEEGNQNKVIWVNGEGQVVLTKLPLGAVDVPEGIKDGESIRYNSTSGEWESYTPSATDIGATSVGNNLIKLTDPGAVSFLRVNADNTISALSAADFRTAIGVGTGTGTVTSVSAGSGMNFTTITGTGAVTLGTPGSLTDATTNGVTATSHTHAVTTVLPSNTSSGIMKASGSKTSGGFYGGTTAPTNTTRLNYDGYLYATKFYGDGSGLTSLSASALPSSIDATKIADGTVDNTEFQYLNGVTSSIQTQLNSKQASLGYTAENSANKVTSFSSPTDTQYPSAKLVSDQLGTKMSSSGSFYLGTTSVAVNRSSGVQTLSGVSVSGNAGTATKLETARTINGVSFDGSSNITISASPAAHSLDSHSDVTITTNSAGEILKWSGTAWINNTLAEAGIQPAGSYLVSSDISGKEDTSNKVTSFSSPTDTQYPSAKLVSDQLGTKMSSSGSFYLGTTSVAVNRSSAAQTLSGVSVSGNAGTATKLETARTINGVSFDGTSNITIEAVPSAHNHSATEITSGTLGVARGGTGIASYTAGNYINASNSTTLQQRTPAQVLSDIGAASSSHSHAFSAITSKPTTLSGYGITDAASSTHTHAMENLSNVTVTSNGSGEILKWNGTAWVNNTLAEAGIQPAGSYLVSADISGKEDTSNKVTSFSSPTDTQYPSAKLVSDQLGTKMSSSGSFYLGTTSVAVNRSSAAQTLSGVSVSGNAGTATKLETARAINGVSFDGTQDITIEAVPSVHNHSATEITSGTLAVARGGTGLASYTAGNYINASNSTTLQQRTPAQVLSDIGAASSTHSHAFSAITSKPTTLSGYGITDAASSSHMHTMENLSNVTVTSNSSGEILKWNGTAWVNNTLAEAGIQPAGSYLISADISGKEDTSNKVTSFSSPTDTQYPSAKLVSDQLGTKMSSSGSFYLGTTSVAVNRSSAAQTLSGVSVSGNAGTATKLETARTINGVSFDGTSNITIEAVPSTHNHSATEITSGTLAVARGGTGLASYTAGNYINASNSTTLQQRTPAQVLSDIGAASSSHSHAFSAITSKPTTLSGYGITDAQSLDGDLTSIAGLAGTSGILKKTAANTWTLDTNSYLSSEVDGSVTNEIQNLSYTASTRVLAIDGTGSTDVTLPVATTTDAGLMSSTDKSKLDGVATGANNYSHPNHTGDVTSVGDGATTIAAGAVTLAKMANMATSSLIYRKTAGTGAPEVQTLSTLKTDLGLTGTNSGDQTITLTGNVTGSGTGSFATTIANNAVTYAKMQTVTASRLLGNPTASAAVPSEISIGSGLSLTTGGVLSATSTSYSASNGLTLSGSTFKLGGTLSEATTVTMPSTYSLDFNAESGSGNFRIYKGTGSFVVYSNSGNDRFLIDGDGNAIFGRNLEVREQLFLRSSDGTMAGLNIPHGTAPTSPSNGDIWTTSGGLFARINGTNEQFATVTWGTNTYLSRAGGTMIGKLNTVASATGEAGLKLPHGTAPTSPVDGDVWTTTSGLFARINGTTERFAPVTWAASTYLPLAGGTMTGKLNTVASATGGAGLTLPHGAAPTSPANGDIWTTTSGLFARINGSTVNVGSPYSFSNGLTYSSGTVKLGGDLTGSTRIYMSGTESFSIDATSQGGSGNIEFVLNSGRLTATNTTGYRFSFDADGSTNATGILTVGTGLTVSAGGADVTGDSFFRNNLTVEGNYYNPSDKRLKRDVETLSGVMDRINQIRGVHFEFINQEKYATGQQIGVIAQELQQVYPELVATGDDGFLKVNYTQLTAVLLQGMKEQQKQINELKERVNQQEQRLDAQQKQIDEIINSLKK